MRRNLMVVGVFAVALIPSMASAQQTCEQRRANQTAGTIAGAGIGAILGSMIAGRGDRTAGAVVGGLGGGLVGNQSSKSGADCAHAYGYYDQGRWRPGPVYGYYDARGRWVSVDNGETQGGGWRGRDIASHEAWLDTRIRSGLNDGSLTRNEGNRALRTLASIQRDERNMRNRGGQLRPRDQLTIHARLDDLAESVRIMGRGPVRQY